MNTQINRIILQGFKSFNKKISVPLLSGFNVICGPNGVGKCLKGDTNIISADGSIHEIRDMVESSLENSSIIEKIDDGFICRENPLNYEIITMNPMTLKLSRQPINAFVKRKSPEFLFKIRTKSGREITTTEYHPFFTIENGIVVSVDADKLKVGQQIATPRVLPADAMESEVEIFNFIEASDNLYVPYSKEIEQMFDSLKNRFGTYKRISEEMQIPYNSIHGVKERQSVNVHHLIKILNASNINSKNIIRNIKGKTSKVLTKINWKLDEKLARFLGYLVSEGTSSSSSDQIRIVNEDPGILTDFSSLSNDLWGLEVGTGNYKLHAVDLLVYSKALQKILDKVFGLKIGSKAGQKIVPPQIFASPEIVIRNFLAALIDGDGYIHLEIDELRRHKAYIEYSTKSKELAEGVVTLFLRLGILASLSEKEKYAANTKERKKQKYYSVIISGIESVRKVKDLLPFHSQEKNKKLERISEWQIEPNPNVDVIPDVNNLVKRLVKTLRINVKKFRKSYPRLQAYYENRSRASRDGLRKIIRFVIENFTLNSEAKKILQSLSIFANSDVFWDEIIGIEKIKTTEEWVYDLSIEGYHNFVANNFIIHNSNILDAIIFVLGRTFAKSLRADRLHELIFHGGNQKNAADYASVTVYLDNTKKTFPYTDEEVSVSRKVNRKGVSIYKINGRTVTREKVLELFSAARIYPDGHNIVLQGDITQIIEMNPVERRSIIDEISGIAEYNDKKDRAARDLEAVDQKLKEAEIVITERFDIYKRLEEESKAALRYQELQQKLAVLKASLAHKKLTEYEKNIKNFDEEIKKKEKENEDLQKKIENIEKDLEEREKGIRELAGKLVEVSKKVEAEREISFLRTKILIDKDKIDSNKREIERLDSLIQRIESIERRVEGELPKSVQEILNQKFSGVHGTVYNLIKVPSKYETAIEIAAGPHLRDVVVDSDDVAKAIIDFLKREKIGRATFIPLNKIKSREFEIDKKLVNQEGVVGIASKLIDFNPKFSPAIEFVFGNTLVVRDLEVAKRIGIGKARMVSLDGDLAERTGVMVGGFLRPRQKIAQNEVSEYQAVKRRLEEEIKKFQEEVGELEDKLKSYGISEETRQLIDMQKLRIDTEEELEKIRNDRKIFYEKRLAVQTELNRFKIQKAKYEADLENVKIEIQQYGQFEFIDRAIRTLEQSIRQTEIELGSLGPVNFKAIEQFEKFRTEFDEYKKRYEKILEEKKAVLDMIEQIESRRKEVFFKAMKELSQKFHEMFNKMAGGGASLNLENPEDLESGLMIQASPAGKVLLNIDSMSGGEKTLTALAFLFAVQEYRPAPFYILDEVDAALDKENSKKIADLIKILSKGAQFIVITHNDTTIKYGDRVYGVTMEGGESKILGLELPK